MKTLLLDGRLRQGGNTDYLLELLFGKKVPFEKKNIAECNNCEACFTTGCCVIKDDMADIYSAANTTDIVVLAAPVIFGSLPAKLISILSRAQCYYKNGNFSSLPRVGKKKQGFIILTAGGSSAGDVKFALKTATLLLKIFNVDSPTIITSLNTDALPASSDMAAKEKIENAKVQFGFR